jgi:hypothetical protein
MLQQIQRPIRTELPKAVWPGVLQLARIVAVMQDDPDAQVGSSWYFIRDRGGERGELYRMVPGSMWAAPRIDPVDDHAYGIEADDLDVSIDGAREYEECPGLYGISDVVHRKLSAVLEVS